MFLPWKRPVVAGENGSSGEAIGAVKLEG